MRPCAPCWRFEWMGDNPPSLRMYFGGGLRVCMALKVILCSGNDASPQHRSVLRAIHTLNSPKYYIRLLGGLLPIHSTLWHGAQGRMWGTRGPFPPAVAMVCYGCVGGCWPLKADIISTYCSNSKKNVYGSIYVDPIHSWHLTLKLKKEDLDLCTFVFSWFLCPVFYGIMVHVVFARSCAAGRAKFKNWPMLGHCPGEGACPNVSLFIDSHGQQGI